jgi:2,3-dihydroxybenzoate decarboxylase
MTPQMPQLQRPATPAKVPYKRIATEEAFATQDMLDIYNKIFASGTADAGFKGLMGFYMSSPSERALHIMRCLVDLDQLRIQHMDESGIDVAVLALTSPGVQVMDTSTAVSFAQSANDELAQALRRHPTRFAGMLAVAPQDPAGQPRRSNAA